MQASIVHNLFRCAAAAAVLVALSVAVSEVHAVPVTSGLVLHFDGDNVTTAGSNVVSWNNQGSLGAAGNLTPPGTAPTFVSGGLNGENVIQFNGNTGEVLRSAVFGSAIPQPNTIFFVLRNDGSNSPVVIDGISTATGRHFMQFRPNDIHIYAGTSRFPGPGIDSSQFRIYDAVYNQASSSINVDGTLYANVVGSIGTQPLGGFAVGNSPPNSNNFPLTGQFAEVLVYDRLLTSEERLKIGSFLEFKFGLDTAFPDIIIPEPGTGLLALCGIGAVISQRSRRRKAALRRAIASA